MHYICFVRHSIKAKVGIMKNSMFLYRQKLILELHKKAKKCVLLYLTVGKFITHLYSSSVNNYKYYYSLFKYCIITVFPLLVHCSKGIHSCYFKPRFVFNKLPKKRVLLYLIMGEPCNSLKVNLFQNTRIADSITNLLLFYYYSHYYSLLFCTPFSTGPPYMKLIPNS
jgi:hypothetical protein